MANLKNRQGRRGLPEIKVVFGFGSDPSEDGEWVGRAAHQSRVSGPKTKIYKSSAHR